MSKQTNITIIIGNLTRDPELKHTNNQIAVTNFSIANNRDYTKDGNKIEKVNYIDIECWNKLAEVCNDYLKKGSQVAVEGEIDQQRWKDQEGNNKSRLKIKANNVQFLSSVNKAENNETVKSDYKPIDGNIPF